MAFKTPLGLYKSTVMTFGLCNAPATFQTFMDIEFGPLIAKGHVVVYLDDILIYATTLTELAYWTHKVFKLLVKLDLYLRPAKCSFNQTSVKYLRLIISEGKLCMDLVKLKAVKDWPTLRKVKDIQSLPMFLPFWKD